MLRLFETALRAVMGELVTPSERCLTYELVLNIVNNYLFDRCDNLDTCLQCGFDDWVWNIILTTGQMTDAEVEFMMSYVNHVPELSYALFDRFIHLCEMLNIDNCAEIASPYENVYNSVLQSRRTSGSNYSSVRYEFLWDTGHKWYLTEKWHWQISVDLPAVVNKFTLTIVKIPMFTSRAEDVPIFRPLHNTNYIDRVT